MDINTVLMILGAAVFILPCVYLLGYARREKQQEGWAADSRAGFNKERGALQAYHAAEMQKERNVVRELEISLLKAGEAIECSERDVAKMTKRWEYADNYRAAIVEVVHGLGLWNFKVHADDPRLMLQVLVDHASKEAVDPATSKKAKSLITRGVRKGAKQGREQMRKLMQKSIDNQATTIEMLRADLKSAEEDVAYAVKRKDISVQAVRNVLADKVALPGVRRSLSQAIIVETGRLRQIAATKGE
ncbi:hypothetical protein HOT57_gp37 [Pseudomonas phage phCDa]|uniref:Uncharacterized protein n=1 Tax=Pseudomonas phage phCDa TaxID=2268587 RepID=A0A2Z5H8I5_9CAUD|nr:hypothetical protein HOT57_gp37 [Pseudomonas phage phCDa]AXC36481.1 hypothetical protein phCDa_37 [Pseudomonas phage phCDa]